MLTISCYVSILLAFDACMSIDNPPALKIIVLDENENPVNGAMVALFNNYEEWDLIESPVQVWRQTNSQGEVLFTDLNEQVYYIYARSIIGDNRGDEISLSEPLKNNIIKEVRVHVR